MTLGQDKFNAVKPLEKLFLDKNKTLLDICVPTGWVFIGGLFYLFSVRATNSKRNA